MSQSSSSTSKWVACYHPRPEAKWRLIAEGPAWGTAFRGIVHEVR